MQQLLEADIDFNDANVNDLDSDLKVNKAIDKLITMQKPIKTGPCQVKNNKAIDRERSRILVADDCTFNLSAMSHQLADFNLNADMVCNGQEAV